jgi:acyl phosphate:glycerol-3-phosphate acyltransferase
VAGDRLRAAYSSLAALTAAATAPIFAYVVGGQDLTGGGDRADVGRLVLTHWQNIQRLWDGTEPKIGSEKPKAG